VFRTPTSAFRIVAIAEAVTWTLLISGLILRATLGWSLAVTIGGGIHGFVFLAYGATAILVALNNRWPAGSTVLALVSAIVPYATIPAEIWLHRRGRLDGAWLTERDEPGPDRRWYDEPLRWFLQRPWVLVLLIAAAVTALFVVLLLIGPPGGK
jgi:integral membrane protein